jgi:hypothetical protein
VAAKMSSLTEIYKQLGANYTDTLKATQDAQANAIALQNARRAQQERMDLKALYAQQANPSFQAIGAISPEYAQTAMKNQLEMQKDMVGMQHLQAQTGEIENKIDREKEALMSNAALPHLNAYEANKGKIPDAENHHRLMTGLSDIANQAKAEGWAPSHYTTLDPNATYESILSNVNKSGVFTDSQQLNQAAAKAQGSQQGLVQGGVAPQPSTYYNSFGHDENGNAFVIPGSSGMWPPGAKSPENTQPPDANATPADPANIKRLAFYEDILKNPDATAEDQAFAEAQIIKLSPKENFKAQPQAVINTPEQMEVKKAELKGKISEAEKAGNLTAEEKAADRKAIETYLRGPKPEAIRNLIKESIEGDVQSGLARLGKFFGVAVPGGDALAALKVIQQQMARSLPYAPGGASDIDVRNRLEIISNPATDEPIVNRLRALEEVIRDAEAYVVQKGDFLSEDQILDSITNGYLSEASALEMLNNRMLNKGNPIYAPTQGNKTSTGVK